MKKFLLTKVYGTAVRTICGMFSEKNLQSSVGKYEPTNKT